MFRLTKQYLGAMVVLTVMALLTSASSIRAQSVMNGGFESSNTGIVDTTEIKGWLILVASGITPPPVYEIVSDTVESGSRAIKVTLHGLGSNQWDIQLVSDSIKVTPGTTYNFSIWAKSQKAGATVNFTVGNYSYSEYKAIRPATLGTQWQQFTMQFTVNDTNRVIRAPIHFYSAADTGNSIYIDNLRIVDASAGKKPVIVQAESGVLGTNYAVLQDGSTTYISPNATYTGLASPGDTSRMATYQITFPDSGYYDLFARLRVGSGTFDDDSYFFGNGFGVKNDTAGADWVFINGLASAGFSDSSALVRDPGTLGSGTWKWVNVTRNSYQGESSDSFYVDPDSLTRTFQIGSREDGLDIDKFAFGKSYLYFTVRNLDSVQAGSATPPSVDTGTVWNGPALAAGKAKFLGSAYLPNQEANFLNYWNQVTPENAGKFGSVGVSADSSQWNWTGLDASYNFAIDNKLPFKEYCLVWGNQQPAWITGSGLDSAQQRAAIEQWIRMVGQRYPKIDMVDVVNEPLPGHAPAPYAPALGGAGATGWDWVIWAFQKAREYMPNAKLILNDYNILNSNTNTTALLQIVNLLKDRNLIDGIGIQGHRFELESADTAMIRSNLDRLWATGIPIYISEFDLGNPGNSGTPDDNQQLNLYKKVFPMLWQHRGVKGITVWGYKEGLVWQTSTYLERSDGSVRPALLWMADYIKNNPLGVQQVAANLPTAFQLDQNYPNPFNPTTTIRYQLPKVSRVVLKVYDVIGREVATLVNEKQNPGYHEATFNASKLSSGVYFYRITAGTFNASKKLVLVK